MEQMATAQAYLAAVRLEETREHVLAGRLGLGKVLHPTQIVGLTELPSVPSSAMLIKGMLEAPGSSIPLVDLRMKLTADLSQATKAALALIIDLEGAEVGLIIDTGFDA
ncbi:MAG TPA: chemotaxis protein CheW [Phycisphaerae bacterium]|nr:chemotaxis protein CheW [Phycisphaerae bacterium]